MKTYISLAVAVLTLVLFPGWAHYSHSKVDPRALTTVDPMPGVGEIKSVERITTFSSDGCTNSITMKELRETKEAAQVRLRLKELETRAGSSTQTQVGIGILPTPTASVAAPVYYNNGGAYGYQGGNYGGGYYHHVAPCDNGPWGGPWNRGGGGGRRVGW